MIYFKDKLNSPYDISRPEEFLSVRSIQRRVKRKASLTTSDLPVNPGYVQLIKDAGIKVLYRSRWFNAVVVEAQADQISAVSTFPIVSSTAYLGPGSVPVASSADLEFDYTHLQKDISARQTELAAQLAMVGIDQLHADGFEGEGIRVAVTDSGFPGINAVNDFSGIYSKVKDSYNFVFKQNNVFGFDDHGTTVLSVIGGNGGSLRGSAPKAEYLLYVTEHVPTEFRIEEFNWVLAAERADSAGADVINTSLGYFTFDDTSMNYRYSDMDGKTTVISKAAQIASEVGILVVASAGNEGSGAWQYITAPADAKDVLAVGAVDASMMRASFSSKGPAADGRIKPDLMALGVATNLLTSSGSGSFGNGTSYSAPILTGFAAGVLQSFPDLTIKEILARLRESGSKYQDPDGLMGFGIPSYIRLKGGTVTELSAEDNFFIYPNPVINGKIRIKDAPADYSPDQLQLQNVHGQSADFKVYRDETTGDLILHVEACPAGIYFLKALGKVTRIVIR